MCEIFSYNRELDPYLHVNHTRLKYMTTYSHNMFTGLHIVVIVRLNDHQNLDYQAIWIRPIMPKSQVNMWFVFIKVQEFVKDIQLLLIQTNMFFTGFVLLMGFLKFLAWKSHVL